MDFFVYSSSDLEAVRVLEADEYNDLDDILNGAHPSICAGDIVQPVKDEKGVKSYLPFTLVVSCTSSDDKVCTLFFSCWSLYYVVAFHSGSLFSSGNRVSYSPLVKNKQVMAGDF